MLEKIKQIPLHFLQPQAGQFIRRNIAIIALIAVIALSLTAWGVYKCIKNHKVEDKTIPKFSDIFAKQNFKLSEIGDDLHITAEIIANHFESISANIDRQDLEILAKSTQSKKYAIAAALYLAFESDQVEKKDVFLHYLKVIEDIQEIYGKIQDRKKALFITPTDDDSSTLQKACERSLQEEATEVSAVAAHANTLIDAVNHGYIQRINSIARHFRARFKALEIPLLLCLQSTAMIGVGWEDHVIPQIINTIISYQEFACNITCNLNEAVEALSNDDPGAVDYTSVFIKAMQENLNSVKQLNEELNLFNQLVEKVDALSIKSKGFYDDFSDRSNQYLEDVEKGIQEIREGVLEIQDWIRRAQNFWKVQINVLTRLHDDLKSKGSPVKQTICRNLHKYLDTYKSWVNKDIELGKLRRAARAA